MAIDWASEVGQEIEADSWDDCVNLLLSSGATTTIYRGHRCFEWNLESSLERALQEHAQRWDDRKYGLMQSHAADPDTDKWATDVESANTDYFCRSAGAFEIPNLPEPWDMLGWWEMMQHHGAPTRLMDWTRSPFTALWFALDRHADGSGDMALWVYDRRTGEINHQEAFANVNATDDHELQDDRQFQNRLVRSVIEDGNPTLLAVRPRLFQRVVAQQSILTVSPSIGVARPANWWIRKRLATRVLLKEEWKPQMLATCRSMGLSRPGLFRDLDSLGSYITQSFIDRVDTFIEL